MASSPQLQLSCACSTTGGNGRWPTLSDEDAPRFSPAFGERVRRVPHTFAQFANVWETTIMHRNPVKRGLVGEPDQWKWSSFRPYACGLGEDQLSAVAGEAKVSCGWERRMIRDASHTFANCANVWGTRRPSWHPVRPVSTPSVDRRA